MKFLVIDPRTKTAVSTHATLAEAIPHWTGMDIMVGTGGDRKTLRQWREDAGAYDPNREAYEHAMRLHTIPESHLDHQVSAEHIEWAKDWIKVGINVGRYTPGEVHVWSMELPPELPGLWTALREAPESEVTYQVRPPRKCASRTTSDRMAWTRQMTAVFGPHEGIPFALYTAYGGPAAPREPGDPSIANMAELEESREFWTTHALAVGGPPTGPEEWA